MDRIGVPLFEFTQHPLGIGAAQFDGTRRQIVVDLLGPEPIRGVDHLAGTQQFVAGIAPAAVAEQIAGPPHQGFGIGVRGPGSGRAERQRQHQRQDPVFSHKQINSKDLRSGIGRGLRRGHPCGAARRIATGGRISGKYTNFIRQRAARGTEFAALRG